MMEVDIEGYYCISKQYPELASIYLPKDLFKLSIRRFDIDNLKICSMTRLVGNAWNCKKHIAVIDVKGSLTPFFIAEEKATKLKEMMMSVKSLV